MAGRSIVRCSRRVLGRARLRAGRYRTDRGDPRARGNALGRQRRQRRDQHHYEEGQGHAKGPMSARAAGRRNAPTRPFATAARSARTATIASMGSTLIAARSMILACPPTTPGIRAALDSAPTGTWTATIRQPDRPRRPLRGPTGTTHAHTLTTPPFSAIQQGATRTTARMC